VSGRRPESFCPFLIFSPSVFFLESPGTPLPGGGGTLTPPPWVGPSRIPPGLEKKPGSHDGCSPNFTLVCECPSPPLTFVGPLIVFSHRCTHTQGFGQICPTCHLSPWILGYLSRNSPECFFLTTVGMIPNFLFAPASGILPSGEDVDGTNFCFPPFSPCVSFVQIISTCRLSKAKVSGAILESP